MPNGLKSLINMLPAKMLNSILAAVGLLVIAAVIFSPYIPYSIQLNEGDIAQETLVSPRYIEVETSEDRRKTEELRNQRASLVQDIYTIDENINKRIIANIVNLFTRLKEYTESPSDPLPKELNFLPRRLVTSLAQLNEKELSNLEYFTIQSADRILSRGIRVVDEIYIRETVIDNLRILDLGNNKEQLIVSVILHYIEPNLVFSEANTKLAREREARSIKPFTTILKEGTPIFYKGETITSTHIEILRALNIYGLKANLIKYVGIFIVTFLVFLLFERFLYYFNYAIYQKIKYFALTYLIILIVVSIARLLLEVTVLPHYFEPEYLIPIPIAAMVFSLLVTPNISLLAGSIISLLIAIMYRGDMTLFLFLFLSNAVTAFATYRRYTRKDLIFAGYTVGLFNILIILGIGLFKEVSDPIWFGSNALIAFVNGVFSSMLALAFLPYLEDLFGITTSQTLLELCNLNHPLLKRLMLTAPGTYQHSLMVANLAEAAAEAINADVILARVGAYFHDIGKMKRPIFFTENQFSIENPHNTLTPRMSKLIIAAHPKDGVEMAIKYKLPDVLKDFMLQHHGTSLVSFFYSQVVQQEDIKDPESTKEEFRYPGPKPQFKESGVVMLADAVEATIRSMEKPTQAKIESLIEKIFRDKIEDNQLVECPISLREINVIKETFLRMYKGIHHSRLDYQDELKNIMDQNKKASDLSEDASS